MRQALIALTAMTCLYFVDADATHAQPQPGATVKITNKTDLTVVVRSYTVVNGQKRPGSLFQLPKGETGYDLKVPNGIRFYTIINNNNGKQLMAQDQGVPVQGRDLSLSIVQIPPNRYALVPD